MDKKHAEESLFHDPARGLDKHQLERDFILMKDYLLMCFRKEDWHGVMDASADIREIVSKLSILNWVEASRQQQQFGDQACTEFTETVWRYSHCRAAQRKDPGKTR